jgi:hypothetical protein
MGSNNESGSDASDEVNKGTSVKNEPPPPDPKQGTAKAPELPSYHKELTKAKEGLSPEQQEMLEKAYKISKGRFG